jgi:hypothetical protein
MPLCLITRIESSMRNMSSWKTNYCFNALAGNKTLKDTTPSSEICGFELFSSYKCTVQLYHGQSGLIIQSCFNQPELALELHIPSFPFQTPTFTASARSKTFFGWLNIRTVETLAASRGLRPTMNEKFKARESLEFSCCTGGSLIYVERKQRRRRRNYPSQLPN